MGNSTSIYDIVMGIFGIIALILIIFFGNVIISGKIRPEGISTLMFMALLLLISIIIVIGCYYYKNKTPSISGGVQDKEKVLNKSVDEIVKIYSRNPKGFVMRSPESQPLRDIGQRLADAGGMELMLQAHKMAVARGVNGRNLEACWDGIGGWAG